MKILHTSDWHLGMPLALGTMIDDQRYFLQQLYDIIASNNIDIIICAGDIYDTGVSNAEAISIYNEAVTKICIELNKKMIVIAGNHDSAARLASCNELLKTAGLYVYGKITRDIVPISFDNTDIYPIPFFNRDEIIALFPEFCNKINSQEDATMVLCDHIRGSMDKSKVNIAVSHSYIVNAELSESDRAAKVGTATAVSKDVFDGFDYVALGHIHKPQVINEHIRYSGSPIKYSFGNEENHTKQVIIFDTDTKAQIPIELEMNHDRRSISGTYEEIMSMDGHKNDYLKITVTDRIANLTLLSELKVKFPFILELYGKSFNSMNEASSITVDKLGKMNETDIMIKFLEEEYDFIPNDEQINLFKNTLEKIEEEED